jgi:hypothetical protein
MPWLFKFCRLSRLSPWLHNATHILQARKADCTIFIHFQPGNSSIQPKSMHEMDPHAWGEAICALRGFVERKAAPCLRNIRNSSESSQLIGWLLFLQFVWSVCLVIVIVPCIRVTYAVSPTLAALVRQVAFSLLQTASFATLKSVKV